MTADFSMSHQWTEWDTPFPVLPKPKSHFVGHISIYISWKTPVYHRKLAVFPPFSWKIKHHPWVWAWFHGTCWLNEVYINSEGLVRLATQKYQCSPESPMLRARPVDISDRVNPDQPWIQRNQRTSPTINKHNWLVVTGTCFLFSHILGMSSSQLTHIFQRGRYTTNHIHRLSID